MVRAGRTRAAKGASRQDGGIIQKHDHHDDRLVVRIFEIAIPMTRRFEHLQTMQRTRSVVASTLPMVGRTSAAYHGEDSKCFGCVKNRKADDPLSPESAGRAEHSAGGSGTRGEVPDVTRGLAHAADLLILEPHHKQIQPSSTEQRTRSPRLPEPNHHRRRPADRWSDTAVDEVQ